MSIEFKYYNADNGQELTNDPINGGLVFGNIRNGKTKTIPIKIKNVGTSIAYGVELSASTYNRSDEVSVEDYKKQEIAKGWKDFSFYQNEEFQKTLLLGNVGGEEFVKGVRDEIIDFKTNESSKFTMEIAGGVEYSFTSEGLITNHGEVGNTKASKCNIIQNKMRHEEVDIEFYAKFSASTASWTKENSFLTTVLRKDSLGDSCGYCVSHKVNDVTGQQYVDIRRNGMGMANATGSLSIGDFYTRSCTEYYPYTPGKQYRIRYKIKNNENGEPCISIWIDGVLQKFNIVEGVSIPVVDTYIDTKKTYPSGGTIYTLMCAYYGGSFVYTNQRLKTVDDEGRIYVRTTIGDDAVDKEKYLSAIELNYLEQEE